VPLYNSKLGVLLNKEQLALSQCFTYWFEALYVIEHLNTQVRIGAKRTLTLINCTFSTHLFGV